MRLMIESMGHILLSAVCILLLCGILGLDLYIHNTFTLLSGYSSQMEACEDEEEKEVCFFSCEQDAAQRGYRLEKNPLSEDVWLLSLSYEAKVWFLKEKVSGCVEGFVR